MKPAPAESRRHDLDALRAFAMLLGILLHGAMSFFPSPWPVHDASASSAMGTLVTAIHQFRMPLFFLLSGYFTMLTFRRRGLVATLRQRATRILLPCLVGLITIVPLTQFVSGWAFRTGLDPRRIDPDSLVGVLRRGDIEALQGRSETGLQLDVLDPYYGLTPLSWAALSGDGRAVAWLIARGADVGRRNRDGGTALHVAAFRGAVDAYDALLAAGADANARSAAGEPPLSAATLSWSVTESVYRTLDLPTPDRLTCEAGRDAIRLSLASLTDFRAEAWQPGVNAVDGTPWEQTVASYRNALSSERWIVTFLGRPWHLIQTNLFQHLWFLWYLCWLVSGFALLMLLSEPRSKPRSELERASGAWPLLLWPLPLSLITHSLMDPQTIGLGPDTGTGLIPPPHLLIHYGLFYAFGAKYFDTLDTQGTLGRQWWLLLPLAVIAFLIQQWLGAGDRVLGLVTPVLVAWLGSLGLMGLFHHWLRQERRWVRYLADASYWLYLSHLPLVIAFQALVRDLSWPLPLKFAAVTIGPTLVLLVVYHLVVRHTVIGRVLQGPRRYQNSASMATTTLPSTSQR